MLRRDVGRVALGTAGDGAPGATRDQRHRARGLRGEDAVKAGDGVRGRRGAIEVRGYGRAPWISLRTFNRWTRGSIHGSGFRKTDIP